MGRIALNRYRGRAPYPRTPLASMLLCTSLSPLPPPSDPEEQNEHFTSEGDYIINFAVDLPHPGSRKLILGGPAPAQRTNDDMVNLALADHTSLRSFR